MVGVPGHIVFRQGKRVVITDPKQINDPLSEALAAVAIEVNKLQERGRLEGAESVGSPFRHRSKHSSKLLIIRFSKRWLEPLHFSFVGFRSLARPIAAFEETLCLEVFVDGVAEFDQES